MYPLKSIVDFLITGVSRIPADEQMDALCSMFAGLLPDMNEADIAIAREQVAARFWSTPQVATPVLDLIDGHMALRSLLQDIEEENATSEESGETESEDSEYDV